jgi:hypothetical protein
MRIKKTKLHLVFSWEAEATSCCPERKEKKPS